MNAAGVRAGRAYVELGANDASLAAAMRRAEQRIRAFADGLVAVGSRLAAFGTAAAVPFGAALNNFGEFESAIARVRAILQERGGGGAFAELEKEALRLGATTMFTATDAAKAMAMLTQAGQTHAQVMAASEPVLRLAETAQTDLATSAKTLMNIMNASGIEATELAAVVDVLGSMSVNTMATLDELGNSVKYVGAVAKAAGLSFHEAMAAIQLLSNTGMEGDMAGTVVRGILQSLTNLTPAAAEQLKRLGVRVKDVRGDMLPLADIIEQLDRATRGMGTADRSGALGQILPDRQMAGALVLVMKSADRLRELTRALEQSGGTASRIARTQMDTLKGSLDELSSSVENVMIAVGRGLSPAVRGLSAGLGLVADLTAAWAERNAAALQTAGAAVLAVTGLGLGMVALGLGLKVVLAAGGAFATVAGAVAAVVALAAHPVVLLAGGLTALALQFDTVRSAAGSALAWLGDGLSRLAGEARETFGAMADAVATGDLAGTVRIASLSMSLAWAEATQSIRLAWVDVEEYLTGAWDSLTLSWDTFCRNLALAFEGAVGVPVSEAWSATTSFLAGAWDGFVASFEATAGVVAAALAGLAEKAGGLVAKLARAVGLTDALGGFGEGVGGFVAGFLNPLGALTQQHEGTADLAEAAEEKAAGRKDDFAARRESLRAELERLRKERADAMAEATAARDRKLHMPTPVPEGGPGARPPSGAAVQAAAARADQRGTFDADLGGRLGVASNLAREQLDAARETAANTRALVRGQAEGGFV